MAVNPAVRIRAAVLVLVFACVASVLMALSRAHVTDPLVPSRTELYGRRVAPLRQALPKAGVVGYLSPEDTTWWGLRRARYFLAPLQIDRGIAHDVIIGDFARRAPTPEWLARNGLAVKLDLRNGLMILERSAR